jgi:hypothetical protein
MVRKVKSSQLKIKNLVLIINTAFLEKISLILSDGFAFRKKVVRAHSDKILFFIDKLLQKNKIKIDDIKGVIAVSGPGSFTAVRLGVTVANTFGFALHVPVADMKLTEFKNDQELIKIGFQQLRKTKVGKIVFPFYGGEPNITKPRKY